MEFFFAWAFVLHILEKLQGLKAWFKHPISVTVDAQSLVKEIF